MAPAVAYVPVIVPLPIAPLPFTMETWEQALSEFHSIPDEVFHSDGDLTVLNARVERLNKEESQAFRRQLKIGFVGGHEAFWKVVAIRITATIKLQSLVLDRKSARDEAQGFHDEIAALEFGHLVRRWMVAALLAKPGILSFCDVVVGHGQLLYERDEGTLGLFEDALELAEKMKWPTIYNLEIASLWRWLQKIPDFNSDFGLSQVGIAVAAFSHLLGRRKTTAAGEKLLWALLGLEALYTTGTTELSSQLVTKTQLFLGEQSTFKKVISQMYHYRSRFVHGAVKIPMDYCHYDAAEAYEVYARDIDRHSEIGTNVLTSTLQTLARRGWTELSFKWSVVAPSDEDKKIGG